MIVFRPYTTVELAAQGFDPGASVGLTLYASSGALYRARTTVGVVESPADSGLFTATLVSPAERGAYGAVWDDGAGVATGETFLVRPAGRHAELQVGDTFVGMVVGMSAGLVGDLGVRIEDGQGPDPIPSTPILDRFSRIDGPVGGGWNEPSSAPGWWGPMLIGGGRARSTDWSGAVALRQELTGPDVEAHSRFYDSEYGFGVGVRVFDEIPTEATGYFLDWFLDDGWYLYRLQVGVYTELAYLAAPTFPQGGQVTLKAIGSTITGYLDGVQVISAQDSAITAAGHAALLLYDPATGADEYGAGTITAPDGLVTPRTTVGVVELATGLGLGIYARPLVAPGPPGIYTVVWDSPGEPTAAEQVEVFAAPLDHENRLSPDELDEVREAGVEAWLDEVCEVRRRPDGGSWAAVATAVPCALTTVGIGGGAVLGGTPAGGEYGDTVRLDLPTGTPVRAGDVVLTPTHRVEVSVVEPPQDDAMLLAAYGRAEEL